MIVGYEGSAIVDVLIPQIIKNSFFMRDSLELELRRLSSSLKAQELQE